MKIPKLTLGVKDTKARFDLKNKTKLQGHLGLRPFWKALWTKSVIITPLSLRSTKITLKTFLLFDYRTRTHFNNISILHKTGPNKYERRQHRKCLWFRTKPMEDISLAFPPVSVFLHPLQSHWSTTELFS